MKLDDFDKLCEEYAILNQKGAEEDHKIMVKNYIISKLQEFGERLRVEQMKKDWQAESVTWNSEDEFIKGYNKRQSELNTQIDKELSELTEGEKR